MRQVPTGGEIMTLNSRNIQSPVHIWPFSFRSWAQNEKKKNDCWITKANIFPPSPILDRTTEGFSAAGSLGYHYMPHSKNVYSAFQYFLGEIRLPHPIPNIISVPFFLSVVWLPLYISPPAFCCLLSLLLFCSQSGSCLGPLGPGSYQLVMGPGGSGPRPWTETDWLASYLHSGLCVPVPPLHAAVLSELGQTEKNATREHKHTKHTYIRTHRSTERLDLIKCIVFMYKLI